MKLLFSAVIFSIFLVFSSASLTDYEFEDYESNDFIYDSNNENCPLDKSEWCTDKKIKENYKCTLEDEKLMEEERKIFKDFMTNLEEYDKLKLSRFTIECINKNEIRPVEVKFQDNKTDTKYKLYEVHQPELMKCNNCTEYSTPAKYFKCVIPIRETMLNDILGIVSRIKKDLKSKVAKFRTQCNQVLK